MGEEVKMSEYKEDDNEDRILEWEIGLPNADDLTPLSQLLIPPELATAFKISPEPPRTISDVNHASQSTLTGLRNQLNALSSTTFKPFDTNSDPIDEDGPGSESKKMRKVLESEEADSDHSVLDPSNSKTSKRPRLVWTPQLHKRFVEVVNHLGIKTAVPKTIMQMMNVEGLTRENVASHLQKYRLYVKRMQGLSSEGNSGSDQLFGSTPLPPPPAQNGGGGEAGGGGGGGGGNVASSHGNGHMGMGMSFPMPYHVMPMPVYGHNGMHPIHSHHGYHQQHLGFDGNGNGHGHPNGNGNLSYNGYGSLASYLPHPHRVTPNDNM